MNVAGMLLWPVVAMLVLVVVVVVAWVVVGSVGAGVVVGIQRALRRRDKLDASDE